MPAITVFFICPCFKKQSKLLFKQMVRPATETGITAPESQAGFLKCLLLWRGAKKKKKKNHEVISVQVCRWRHTHSLCFLWDQLGQVGQLAPGHLSDPGEQKCTVYYKFLFQDNATCERSLFLSATAHQKASKKWCTPLTPTAPPKKQLLEEFKSAGVPTLSIPFSCHLAALGSPTKGCHCLSPQKAGWPGGGIEPREPGAKSSPLGGEMWKREGQLR